MIGVTLASPVFSDIAREASERFTRFTGLRSVIIRTPEEKNYAAKLDLYKMFDETVVWFDADHWILRPCNLEEFDGQEEFIGVRDPGIHDPTHFPFHDSQTLGIDLLKYINTGFFIWDSRNPHHKAAFEEAKVVLEKMESTLGDFGEQSSLNAGIQRKSKIRLVTNSLNYIAFAEVENMRAMIPMANPLTVHAAGYTFEEGHKEAALRYFSDHLTNRFGNRAGYPNHIATKS